MSTIQATAPAAPVPGQVPEVDETGTVTGNATLNVVKPSTDDGSFIEITDSTGEKSSA